MDYNKIIKNLPKVDLHCHLDGSLRPQTIIDIAVKENIDIPTKELKEFEKYVKVFGECNSLKDYLDKFELPIKVMQNKKNIYRITSELLEDVSKNNVKYIEIRFAPFNHIQKGLKAEEVIEAVIEAMGDGRKKYGVMSNLILCAMRHESVESSKRLVEIGKKYLGKGVVAVDLAGNEHDFPPEIHKEAFDLAQKYGFHCTIHAGETGIEKNIIKSIELLHAERIGHGVYAFKDERVVEYLKDKQIPLEMCITSNIDTKAVKAYELHPIKKYLDEGLVVTVNTDNMTVSNVSLNDEFNHLVKEQNFTLEDIKRVVKNGIETSFASEDDKNILRKQYEKALEIL
ncbi:adenosine deaminase [Clostridium sp. JS66]|uniref:adenosine deaminase n=1 Tax=Clostridium sp. JS66 TaxID=3064705 RepID=UPI00298DCC0D|nr:adenosine deaminase [Clostridium sp. JS66]WPC40574.1 adenosine deaminase [Clostridium sp. JS66]